MKNFLKKLAFWLKPETPAPAPEVKKTIPKKPAKVYRMSKAKRRARKMVRLARKITRGNKHARGALRRITK